MASSQTQFLLHPTSDCTSSKLRVPRAAASRCAGRGSERRRRMNGPRHQGKSAFRELYPGRGILSERKRQLELERLSFFAIGTRIMTPTPTCPRTSVKS